MKIPTLPYFVPKVIRVAGKAGWGPPLSVTAAVIVRNLAGTWLFIHAGRLENTGRCIYTHTDASCVKLARIFVSIGTLSMFSRRRMSMNLPHCMFLHCNII